jgi:Gas vesicle synthesis protein GvpL/GvpF
MPTYLYCVLTREDRGGDVPAAVLGVDDGPVRQLVTHGLEAWVSTVVGAPPVATVETIKQHDRVVSAALATGRTPLPARFGQTWASDAACAASIGERRAELESLLRRVAGLVEMTVCTLLPGSASAASPPVAAADDAAPGRAYLEGLRARTNRERHLRTALEELRQRVSGALGPLARGEVAEIRGSERALALSVSYLVERGGEARFRAAVADVARDVATRLVVAGPRAPYSFAPAPRQPGPAYAARLPERGR